MEHFNIILGLCRSSLQNENPALEKHVSRLAKALKNAGDKEEAQALSKLLKNKRKASSTQLSPSRVTLSRASVPGESLTPSVNPPVDKETSAPLAEIVFPEQDKAEPPIFSPELADGIARLLTEWRNADTLTSQGITPALTSMFFGAPGTGKTMLAHHVAQELQLPLITARLDGLISSFLGTTARNISTLFSFANRYKCILLLDEFDAVAKLRDDPHELGEIKRVVNTLLQCIDSRAAFGYTIAITNHESLLDPAVWRRFDVRVDIGLPDFNTRTAILRKLLEGRDFSESQIALLSWMTQGESGSGITKLHEFLLRQNAIQGDTFDFIESLRTYILLSASENEPEHRQLVLAEPEVLARALSESEGYGWGQDQIAHLFGCAQSTVSRWLKKPHRDMEVA